ncbi:MAG TPA: hypothetical protein VGF48_09820 [Thermoanaerobaculia bacterium]|jgi:hypothetical protein
MANTSNSNEPFAFGDGTLMQLREQHWDFDELGTMMVPAAARRETAPAPVETVAPAPLELETVEIGEETKILPVAARPILGIVEPAAAADPLARIEQRLEELTRAVLSMQRRLDSIDQAMARFLTR